MKIGEIIINVPTRSLQQAFSYIIPPELDFLAPGWRVIVPFGNREAEGFIIATRDGDPAELKQVKTALDNFPWFDDSMLQLAQWLSDYYLCTLAEALRLFVPGKKGIKTQQLYHLNSCDPMPTSEVFDGSLSLIAFIGAKQPVDRDALVRRFGLDILSKLQLLVNRKLVVIDSQAKTRQQSRFVQEYCLADPALARQSLPEYVKRPAQRRVLETLLEKGAMTKESLKQLGISITGVQKLISDGVLTCRPILQLCDSYRESEITTIERKPLTREQAICLEKIQSALISNVFKPFLLHGITGSGKTEIYMEAAATTRNQGRQVIVLVPEIALTSQIVNRFKNRFGNDVVVFHSKLSLRERYDAWQRLREGQAGIVIGARSAIFAPMSNLGLIVLDEEHEFTYKQEESPRYHARDVALKRAELAGAIVILGSATPAIESYQTALSNQYTLLELTERADGAVLPSVEVVDMREEMAQGRRSVISDRLACLLQDTISRGEQAIVLLNRRGHSTFLLCRECGHVMRCQHCAVSLVYHADAQSLRCHYCRRQETVPDVCPVCESRYIRYFGAGTQKAEEELKRLLPNARILRMDRDTTGGRFATDTILRDFQAGKYDLLLGTQMVAKGHDIANVTAVGILAADSTLNLPDFRAAEKTFALVTQAAGRAGRGQKAGSVIVQTYNPDHYAVQSGAAQDYRQFFGCEVDFRRSLNYPPFIRLIRCTISSEIENSARRDAEFFTAALRSSIVDTGVEILGPFPSTIAKVKDVFRMNILIKCGSSTDIKKRLAQLLQVSKAGITVDVDPYNLL
ncbi:primosomal protein N' [Anaerosporomusa subterranea]|uniref:Replication restart protein PriA n=1 Tax=Anaerosporomusa subterranea TaxID=1794912 RepID=A0A154BTG5_ANASB|nr:primosomal protein N' [Anaerosporomusa subterranea]KYZ77211.1 primosomal protein N' [Anaerosporomusa subterranea]